MNRVFDETFYKKFQWRRECMNNWNSLIKMQEERKQDRRTQDLRIRNSGVPTWNKPLPREKRVKMVRKPVITIKNPFKNLENRLIGWLGLEDLEGEEDATGNNDTQ